MLNKNARAWVEALRSGKYKQTKLNLRDRTGYCCLGVACELAVKSGVIPPGDNDNDLLTDDERRDGVVTYDHETKILPDAVREWLGLGSADGDFTELEPDPVYGDLQYSNLAERNDGGATFEEIADLIESEPDGLFDAAA